MARIFGCILSLIASVSFAAWNPVAIGEELLATQGSARSGYTEDTGVWIVAIGKHSDPKHAALEARRELAGFIATHVESGTVSSTVEVDDAVSTFFSVQTKTSIDQLLQGVRIEKTTLVGENYLAIAVLTQRMVNHAHTLATAIAADRPGTVTAVGYGHTKDAAVQAATRSALEQVCGATVAAIDSAANDRFRARTYTDVQGVVKTYRILEEACVDNQWKVKIVAEVSTDELQDNYGAQLKTMGDPLFFIVADNDDALRQMSDWFIRKGLKTTTHQGTADYQIKITTEFAERTHPAKTRTGIQLQMTTVCFDKAGVQLFSIQNDPRAATSFVGTKDRQCQITVEKAIQQISEPLHQRLQQGMNRMVNNGRSIRLLFRNCTTASQTALVETLVGVINEIPEAGAATLHYNSETQTATIRCNLKGNTHDFVNALREEFVELPILLAAEANKIIFTF